MVTQHENWLRGFATRLQKTPKFHIGYWPRLTVVVQTNWAAMAEKRYPRWEYNLTKDHF